MKCGLLNRILARFQFVSEIPDPDYVYVLKYPEGYLCDGDVFEPELTDCVTQWHTFWDARQQCINNHVIRVPLKRLKHYEDADNNE